MSSGQFPPDTSHGIARKTLDPEVLKSLEQQKGAEVSRGRVHARLETALTVHVRPGNASDRTSIELVGITADLSRGGCRLILPLPVTVGDVFRVEFESAAPRIPLVFARCLRCRLVREDAFEAGFSFFAPIDLPEEPAGGPDPRPD